MITPIPIRVNSGRRTFSLCPGESVDKAASDVRSRATVSTMVVAGPSNASAAATARIHDARLFVVATNPVLNPKASRHDDEDEDGGSMGLRPGSLTHRDASGERLTLYPLIRLD